MRRLLASGLAVVLVLAVGLLIWPTPYRYEHVANRVVRLNRFTGHADALCPDGWHTMTRDPFADVGDVQMPITADVCLIAPRRL